MNIGVAATAPLGADVLERLSERHEIAFLITRPDRPRGRGRQVGAPPAKDAAERLGIEVRQPEKLDESAEVDDVEAIVVAAYGALIPETLLDRTLWLNVHPSLLPRWRGAAPVERAIMAGDTETRRDDPSHDRGARRRPDRRAAGVPDRRRTTTPDRSTPRPERSQRSSWTACSRRPNFIRSRRTGATYAERLTAADRELDWNRPAETLVNQIRALSPHIGARGVVDGRTLTVWRAVPASAESKLTAGGLELLEVQPEGKRRMTGEEYLRGLRG